MKSILVIIVIIALLLPINGGQLKGMKASTCDTASSPEIKKLPYFNGIVQDKYKLNLIKDLKDNTKNVLIIDYETNTFRQTVHERLTATVSHGNIGPEDKTIDITCTDPIIVTINDADGTTSPAQCDVGKPFEGYCSTFHLILSLTTSNTIQFEFKSECISGAIRSDCTVGKDKIYSDSYFIEKDISGYKISYSLVSGDKVLKVIKTDVMTAKCTSTIGSSGVDSVVLDCSDVSVEGKTTCTTSTEFRDYCGGFKVSITMTKKEYYFDLFNQCNKVDRIDETCNAGGDKIPSVPYFEQLSYKGYTFKFTNDNKLTITYGTQKIETTVTVSIINPLITTQVELAWTEDNAYSDTVGSVTCANSHLSPLCSGKKLLLKFKDTNKVLFSHMGYCFEATYSSSSCITGGDIIYDVPYFGETTVNSIKISYLVETDKNTLTAKKDTTTFTATCNPKTAIPSTGSSSVILSCTDPNVATGTCTGSIFNDYCNPFDFTLTSKQRSYYFALFGQCNTGDRKAQTCTSGTAVIPSIPYFIETTINGMKVQFIKNGDNNNQLIAEIGTQSIKPIVTVEPATIDENTKVITLKWDAEGYTDSNTGAGSVASCGDSEFIDYCGTKTLELTMKESKVLFSFYGYCYSASQPGPGCTIGDEVITRYPSFTDGGSGEYKVSLEYNGDNTDSITINHAAVAPNEAEKLESSCIHKLSSDRKRLIYECNSVKIYKGTTDTPITVATDSKFFKDQFGTKLTLDITEKTVTSLINVYFSFKGECYIVSPVTHNCHHGTGGIDDVLYFSGLKSGDYTLSYGEIDGDCSFMAVYSKDTVTETLVAPCIPLSPGSRATTPNEQELKYGPISVMKGLEAVTDCSSTHFSHLCVTDSPRTSYLPFFTIKYTKTDRNYYFEFNKMCYTVLPVHYGEDSVNIMSIVISLISVITILFI